jgi:hypothetical protein
MWDVGKRKHFGTSLTNQNCIREEVKHRLNSHKACCNSVQNPLSSPSLPTNKILKYTIHNVACCFICTYVQLGLSH